MLGFVPTDLYDDFQTYRVAKLMGMTIKEANWLDAAEINRLLHFHSAEIMAQNKSDYVSAKTPAKPKGASHGLKIVPVSIASLRKAE